MWLNSFHKPFFCTGSGLTTAATTAATTTTGPTTTAGPTTTTGKSVCLQPTKQYLYNILDWKEIQHLNNLGLLSFNVQNDRTVTYY